VAQADVCPAAWYRFDAAGCIASGGAAGTKGETLSITRASAAFYLDAAGAWQSCSNNQARVGYLTSMPGVPWLIVEPAATQLYPTPAAPAAGNVTPTATGAHVFAVYGGSGSQTLSVKSGATIVATGLPCTALAGAPCRFTVTTVNDGGLEVGAVTGTLTAAQIETGQSPSSWFSAATRAADAITLPTPAAFPTAAYCLYVKAANGRPWNSMLGSANSAPLTIGGYNATNSSTIWMQSNGTFTASVKDATTLTSSTPYSPPNAYSGHDFALCNAAGSFSGYIDGAEHGTGTRQPAAQPATVLVGTIAGATPSVYVRDIALVPSATFVDRGRAVPRVAMLGDSITAGTGTAGYPDVIGKYAPGRYAFVNWGHSGDTTAVAQTSYLANIKGKGYATLTILVGVNDLRVGTAATAVWTTLKAVIDDALADGLRVVVMTVSPWKGYTEWDAAKQTQTDALNALILAYSPSASYTALDIYTPLEDGANADQLLPAYAHADKLHLTAAGEDKVALLVLGISGLLP
jgi:lysophospholipase L1-like esterase